MRRHRRGVLAGKRKGMIKVKPSAQRPALASIQFFAALSVLAYHFEPAANGGLRL
jgi:hypothetical protein